MVTVPSEDQQGCLSWCGGAVGHEAEGAGWIGGTGCFELQAVLKESKTSRESHEIIPYC